MALPTADELVTAAMGYSTKNRPDQIATKAVELLRIVNRAFMGIYTVAGHVNPEFFADETAVAFAAGPPAGWTRPALALSVWRIENPAGVEVKVVDRNDKAAEIGWPAVYMLKKVYRTAGNALDPVAGNLTFCYSLLPTLVAAIANPVDANWIEQYNELAILEIAIYLALKDGRLDEVAALKADRDKWAQLFIEYLMMETANTTRRIARQRVVNVPAMIQLLAGGAAA